MNRDTRSGLHSSISTWTDTISIQNFMQFWTWYIQQARLGRGKKQKKNLQSSAYKYWNLIASTPGVTLLLHRVPYEGWYVTAEKPHASLLFFLAPRYFITLFPSKTYVQ